MSRLRDAAARRRGAPPVPGAGDATSGLADALLSGRGSHFYKSHSTLALENFCHLSTSTFPNIYSQDIFGKVFFIKF